MLFVQADWVHERLGVGALRFARRAPADANIRAWWTASAALQRTAAARRLALGWSG
jgi:hypothetical protein